MSFRLEHRSGVSVRLYRRPFRLTRWWACNGGFEGDNPRRLRRLRMYQWPFGVVHVTGRWR